MTKLIVKQSRRGWERNSAGKDREKNPETFLAHIIPKLVELGSGRVIYLNFAKMGGM